VLGAETVRVDAGVRANTFASEQFDHIVTRFREYAQRAHDNGCRSPEALSVLYDSNLVHI
jgi:hypothetical protein